MAEKGGSRTLRGPYDPQTGFEDQRHHRAPSFSMYEFDNLKRLRFFSKWGVKIVLPIRSSLMKIHSES